MVGYFFGVGCCMVEVFVLVLSILKGFDWVLCVFFGWGFLVCLEDCLRGGVVVCSLVWWWLWLGLFLVWVGLLLW